MLSRTTALIVLALALAACPRTSSPANEPIDNATVKPSAGACPTLDTPAPTGAAPGPDDCVRGEFTPVLDAPAEAPSCLRVVSPTPISGIEQVVLADHGAVQVEHAGCAHWSLVIRFAAPPGEAADDAAVYAYAARVVRALPARTDDTHLERIADTLDSQASAATPVELGQAVTIADEFEYLNLTIEDGQIVVIDDVAL